MLAMIFDFLTGLFVSCVVPLLANLASHVLALFEIGLDALITLPDGKRFRIRREEVLV